MGSTCLRSEMMVVESSGCYSKALVGVNVVLAFIDGGISVLAFYQLIRIHSRNPQRGCTRHKVFHLMIGSSIMGYGIYFILTLVAACKNWICWSNSCGFVVMALPKILFLAAFLLLLSFWVDLCHQANDEDEDDGSPREVLIKKAIKPNLKSSSRRRCCSFRVFPVGSRQQAVILVTLLILVLMLASAVLIWIGLGKNPIDSSVVARVYVDTFAVAMLLLGGALACYGYVLVSKMSKVRSERTSSEMWKFFAGWWTCRGFYYLFYLKFCCFFSTNIPVLYHCDWRSIRGIYVSLLLIVYYFIGKGYVAFWCYYFWQSISRTRWLQNFLMPQLPKFMKFFDATIDKVQNFFRFSSYSVVNLNQSMNFIGGYDDLDSSNIQDLDLFVLQLRSCLTLSRTKTNYIALQQWRQHSNKQ